MTDMTPVDIRYTWYTHDAHMTHTCSRAFVCDVSVIHVIAVSFGFAWVHSGVQALRVVLQAQAILEVF